MDCMTYTIGHPHGFVDHVDSIQAGVSAAIAAGSGRPVLIAESGFGFWELRFEQPGWKLYAQSKPELAAALDILKSQP